MTMKSGLLLTAVLALGACEAKAPPAAAATAPAAAPLTNFEAYPVEVFTGPATVALNPAASFSSAPSW